MIHISKIPIIGDLACRFCSSVKEYNIHRYFCVHQTLLSGDASIQLQKMEEAVASYAKKNKVSINVYEMPVKGPDVSFVPPSERVLQTYVEALDHSDVEFRCISGDTTRVYPKEAKRTFIITDTADGVDIARTAKSTTEDNCVRNFYRNIEEMVNRINSRRNK